MHYMQETVLGVVGDKKKYIKQFLTPLRLYMNLCAYGEVIKEVQRKNKMVWTNGKTWGSTATTYSPRQTMPCKRDGLNMSPNVSLFS